MKNKTTYKRSMHDKMHPYTLISAELINNNDLTGEERFLLIYLLGRSDNYILNSSYFAKESQKLFGWGRDKFQNTWNSLKDKDYIVKEQMREKGRVAGYHYTVNEVLKNRCPENPGSGESVSRQTSALPSIDKPNIDKPIADQPSARGATSTNQKDTPSSPAGGSLPLLSTLELNDQVKDIFKLIRELNPPEYSKNWRMNDQDRKLIAKSIKEHGFVNTQAHVIRNVHISDKKPYCSVSYIFSDLKNERPEITNIEAYLKDNPELITDLAYTELSDEKVEVAQRDCKDNQQLYDFIKNAVLPFHEKAKHWKASDEDLEYCERLLYYDLNIPLAEKLRHGLVSAFKKGDWRFGQIVYQAITAVDTKEVLYS